jgi:hypothetical protein
MIETNITRKIFGKYDYYYNDESKKVFLLDNEEVTLDNIFKNIDEGTEVEITIKTQ